MIFKPPLNQDWTNSFACPSRNHSEIKIITKRTDPFVDEVKMVMAIETNPKTQMDKEMDSTSIAPIPIITTTTTITITTVGEIEIKTNINPTNPLQRNYYKRNS